MKKLAVKILLILLAVCALCSACILSACGSGEEIIDRPESSQTYNSFIDYSFLYTDADECPDGNFTEDKLQSSRTFALEKTNYIVAFFTLNSPNQNGWNAGEKFNVKLSVSPCSYISTILEEASTSTYSESVDGETKSITLTYSVPELKEGQSKTYRVALAFSAEKSATAEIDLSIRLESEDISQAPVVADCITIGANKFFKFTAEGDGYCVSKADDSSLGVEYCYIPKHYRNKIITEINKIGGSDINKVHIPDSVISIDWYAFEDCNGLTYIEIPDGVKSIGFNAFSGCSGLSSIEIPDGVTSIGYNAFYGCTGLTKIAIPESVTNIESDAFRDCSGLLSITIPDSVKSIGSSAFFNTAYYKNANNWKNSVLYIGKHLINADSFISGEYVIKNGTLTIGDSAFCYCDSLTSVTIPDSVTRIGSSAFEECSNLASINIPDSVISVGDYAFRYCYSLTNVSIGKSVTSIADYTFGKCIKLVSLTIPDSVTSIGSFAFEQCSKLTNITIPNSVTSIGPFAFKQCINLTSVSIPDSVTSIGSFAFSGCSKLDSVIFKNTSGWLCSSSSTATGGTSISSDDLSDPSIAATYLKSTYSNYYWRRG